MIIKDEKDKEMLLADKPFYSKERNTFCLGSSMEDAGRIFREMLSDNDDFQKIMKAKQERKAKREQEATHEREGKNAER